jgi:DNA-binding winged helix-turn-helix (wHTH) protein
VPGPSAGYRYRFGPFSLSPGRRELLRDNAPVSLIPKYFDLLCLLIDRRAEALGRQAIFDAVWPDVIVSDSALTQAIRTLRRALDDSPRTPVYIRTVSRHGYQFVFAPVVIEAEPAVDLEHAVRPEDPSIHEATGEPIEQLVARVLGAGEYAVLPDEERREAAAALHTAAGTERALHEIEGRPGAERARALLRESRWDIEGAGDVPILGAPGRVRTIGALVRLRMHDAARAAAGRLGSAAAGGAIAGAIAGMIGAVALLVQPETSATGGLVSGLAMIGALAGLFGAGMVGAGLGAAEVLARSQRRLALVVCGTVSGLLAGLIARFVVETVFGSLVGRQPANLGGPIEGAIVGLAAACGYALSTPTPVGGGMATPRGAARMKAALVTGLCCGAATAVLGLYGWGTVSVALDDLSLTYDGSQVGLAPLAPLLGEHEWRPVTRAAASAFEGLLFGFGLTFGLTHRPARANSA